MLLAPKNTIIYGPVNSRRLGRSLGVNILPRNQKTCTLNCVYCQYGWTDFQQLSKTDALAWPSTEEVRAALMKSLGQLSIPPAYITFSGNGEPTLHPCFPEIAAAVSSLRDRMVPEAQTAILSNSSLIANPEIRTALSRLDQRIMKLDCGDNRTFLRYNNAFQGIELPDIVQGLKGIKDITIQTLFAAGKAGNMRAAHLDAWLAQIEDIRPKHVQIYTLDREAPATNLIPAAATELQKIKFRVREIGISAEIY